MPMTPNTEQDWKVWRNLMWSEILTESVKSYMDCKCFECNQYIAD